MARKCEKKPGGVDAMCEPEGGFELNKCMVGRVLGRTF